MRQAAALIALVAVVATAAVAAQGLVQERQYRQLLSAGEVALRNGQSYAALEAFSGAITLRPTSMVAFYRRGEAYRQQRQDDKAIRDLREAKRLADDAPQPLVALGALFDLRGDPAQAAEWYSQAADRLKDANPGVLYSLALARYRAGAPAAARDPLRRALALDDSIAEAHYLLGLVRRDAQEFDPAIASLEQAIRLQPALIAAREELVDLYRVRNRGAEEVGQLEALDILDPRPERRVAVALAEIRHGQVVPAIETLRALAKTAPTDSRLAVALGRAHIAHFERFGDRASVVQAQASLEQALAGTARRSEGLALFGRALYLAGDLTGAERILTEAVATSPVDPEAFAFLADASERLGHPRIARDALLDLDALQGDTAARAVRATRAWRIGSLSLSAGDSWIALEFLTHAVESGREDAPTLGLLARARWQTGDTSGAKAALGQALALDARDAGIQRLQRSLR